MTELLCRRCGKNEIMVKKTGLCKTCRCKCHHGKQKSHCIECGGASMCIHEKLRYQCIECGGKGICQHGKRKNYCVDCNGASLCCHKFQKHLCKMCGGTSICRHGRIRSYCIECENAGSICEHRTERRYCKVCSPEGYLVMLCRSRISTALKTGKEFSTQEYLGCDSQTLKNYLEAQFKDGMSWENHGSVWHIDHIVPIRFQSPTSNEIVQRLHYTNLQPLSIGDNLSKGNRYIG